jgi:trehalose 6-phosphate synthase
MGAVVVVSNRGPRSFRLEEDGTLVAGGAAGGLAGTLDPLLAGSGATWVFSVMGEADRLAIDRGLFQGDRVDLRPVSPPPDVYRAAYDVVSNATLWFVFHELYDLPRRPRFDARWWAAWEDYRRFNRLCCEEVDRAAPEGALVLVQDYHLLLAGRLLKELRPDLRTVHFLHTPFCGPDALRVLPTAAAGALLDSMSAFYSCGFHARRWEASYRRCFEDPDLAEAAGTAEPGRTFVAPIGPVPDALEAQAASPACQAQRRQLRAAVGDRRLVVRVDRVELSKNILRGCLAIEELLTLHPAWRGRFVMYTLAYASREGLADYLAYRSELEHTVTRINETWGQEDWQPIVLDVADNRDRSMAALCEYDVLLVNPVRDGLNLVAKEGPLVNTRHGTVVLSREAGAFEELGHQALVVNPFDLFETAEALHAALSMQDDERVRRASALRDTVLGRPARRWLDDQLAEGS